MSNAHIVAPSGPKRRLLIVDDDRDYAEALEDLLELHGYAVATALSGQAALGELGARPFDIALLDMKMPGKSGVPLLIEMRKLAARLAVIVVTGFVDVGVTESAKRAGAYGVLTKPVEIDLLLSTIHRCLEGQSPTTVD